VPIDLVTTPYGRPALLALREAVTAAKAGEPLAPVTVVVPANHAGVTARRLLASGAAGAVVPGGRGLAGVTFVTPYRLAELLGASRLAAAKRRPVSTPVVAAAMRQALAADPGVFAPVASHPATEAALVAAHGLLAEVPDAALAAVRTAGAVVTIGAYDGLHLGHQAVIAQVRAIAGEREARSAVVTFDRHPATVVRPESAPKLLTDHEQRLELFEQTGIDAAVVLPFDEHQAQETPLAFVERVLFKCLRTACVVVGDDFHFGRHREGNVALLREYGATYGFDVEPVHLLARPDGIDEPLSSTAIRRALAGGEVELAAKLLGRPFEARGVVVAGDKRGRLLGFPTANVEVPTRVCLPADGVYAGWYERTDGIAHACAINLGRRPTFYEHADHSLLEAHLIDFDGDLYWERARVRFTNFLRSERKFEGIDALVAQLKLDIEHTRQLVC
jgi:riboflavin kinase/FMN adenylyltransferase